MRNKDQYVVATRGLYGWTDHGIGSFPGSTFRAERHGEPEAPIRVCFRAALASSFSPVQDVWKRPQLDLLLPPGNLRGLTEGCIGYEGSTKGHPWGGDLEEITSFHSCGLDVWLAWCEAHGAEISRSA